MFIYLIPFILGSYNKSNSKKVTAANITNRKIFGSEKEELIQVIVSGTDFNDEEKHIQGIGSVKYKLPMINSYVVEVPKSKIGQLRNIKGIKKVEQDAHITAQMNVARESINCRWALENNITGRGIGVAVLDTGIYPHKDLTGRRNRILAFKDFVNNHNEPYDDNGHGTHVTGIIGGDGYSSSGKYMGIAPDCHFIGVKVLDDKGAGNISDVLAGLQWVIDNKEKYNIKVVNISVGTEDKDGEGETSALVRGVDAVWDNNLVVIVAAGNNGPRTMSITTPGISRKIITVGSSDDKETVNIFGENITNYSGRGPTSNCIKKPDVIAPGSNIVSCNTDKKYKSGVIQDVGYTTKSGTSMATPIISGAVALLLSRHRNISNRDIKLKLKESTVDLGFIQSHQGWGMIDIKKLLS
ncbi:serine protease AprX [Natranaerovirga pectinivora]|uniref:Serine protease AprX n=2 Tax=Natranaerovirga pectinivora TaxID=682400 RepID=A0A4R3ML48_9FIRM|nr:serine protease AprX [Natranaerovirga pectinivora]